MKKIFLSIILLAVYTSVYSQAANNQGLFNKLFAPNSEWLGIVGVGIGGDDFGGMSISMDAELGKNIAPKLFLGGGLALNKAGWTSMGVYLSPKYFFSEDFSSFYIESSLGLTLLSTIFEPHWGALDESKRVGCTTNLAVGYKYKGQYAVEIGTTLYKVKETSYDYSRVNSDIYVKLSYLLNFKKR